MPVYMTGQIPFTVYHVTFDGPMEITLSTASFDVLQAGKELKKPLLGRTIQLNSLVSTKFY